MIKIRSLKKSDQDLDLQDQDLILKIKIVPISEYRQLPRKTTRYG